MVTNDGVLLIDLCQLSIDLSIELFGLLLLLVEHFLLVLEGSLKLVNIVCDIS